MRGQTSAITRSEALQRISDRKECPSLLECEATVTQDYFRRICGTRGYVKCHHYAKSMGELKPPMTWLQYQAMYEAVKDTEDPKPQTPVAMK